MTSSETVLFAPSGAEVYRWRNLDDDGEFTEIIHHSDGRLYLLFRIDLYGYGVYDLTGQREFFYIPDEKETFIWTDVHYNPVNDRLAVGGCFWACPNGIHLLDFSEPMRETAWVDVLWELDGGYDTRDMLDFIRWEGSSLILESDDEILEENGKRITRRIELIIPEEQYSAWFLS